VANTVAVRQSVELLFFPLSCAFIDAFNRTTTGKLSSLSPLEPDEYVGPAGCGDAMLSKNRKDWAQRFALSGNMTWTPCCAAIMGNLPHSYCCRIDFAHGRDGLPIWYD
jgi:hypothetical protein